VGRGKTNILVSMCAVHRFEFECLRGKQNKRDVIGTYEYTNMRIESQRGSSRYRNRLPKILSCFSSTKAAFLQNSYAVFVVISVFIQALGASQQQTEFRRYSYGTERADLGLSGHP
jgi:hypothetical protein